MMARCNCAGNTCACKVEGGAGINVEGIGTAANPFVVTLDDSSIAVGQRIQLDNSTTVELVKVGDGTGTQADPLILRAAVVLRSPDNSRWGPTISNTGTVTWAKL